LEKRREKLIRYKGRKMPGRAWGKGEEISQEKHPRILLSAG
jgi:hypothetical protein